MFLESLGTTMLLSLGRLPPCREPTSSNNVLHDIARRGESASLLRVDSLVAREEEAHGRPEEVLLVVLLQHLSTAFWRELLPSKI